MREVPRNLLDAHRLGGDFEHVPDGGRLRKLLAGRESPEREDLVSALLNLGFRRKEAEGVVDATLRAHKGEPPDFEKLLRECLKKMARV